MVFPRKAAIAIAAIIIVASGVLAGFSRTTLKPSEIPSQEEILPWLIREDGILLEEDFSSVLVGWTLKGKSTTTVDEAGEKVWSGEDGGTATPLSSEWSDYTFRFRVKIITGSCNIDFRIVPDVGFYSLELNPERGHRLAKMLDQIEYTLSRYSGKIYRNRWCLVKIEVKGNIVKIWLENELSIHYTDDSTPYRVGGCRFRAFSRSRMLVDDFFAHGVKLSQKVRWFATYGPPGGIGFDIVIHPRSSNIVYAADNPSGVLRSEDGGRTWKTKNRGITAFSGPSSDGVPIYSVTVDPNDPSILWAGAQGTRGVFKSTDGGETWTRKDRGILEWSDITVRGFAVKPGNSKVVLMAVEIATTGRKYEIPKSWGRVYLTENGGDNWRSIWNGPCLASRILYDPRNPQIVYVSTGSFDRVSLDHDGRGLGILKSVDGGRSWKQINNTIEVLYVGSIAMDPRDSRVLYAASGGPSYVSAPTAGGIYKTTDGGESWMKILGEDTFTLVVICPSNPDIVYAGSERCFFRSNDGGRNWIRLCNDNEVSWGPKGVKVGVPTSAVVSPTNPSLILVNNYRGGIVRSEDGGKTWSVSCQGYTGVDLQGVSSSTIQGSAVYTIGRSGPFRSPDGGRTWQGLSNGVATVREWYAIATNPQNHNEVLVSDQYDGRIFRSTNAGTSWQLVYKHPAVRELNPNARHGFKVIAYAPSNPKIVFAGIRAERAVVEGNLPLRPSHGMFKSADGGLTWKAVNQGLEKTLRNINAILIDSKNPNVAFIGTLGDGIFKTGDGGTRWVEKNSGLVSLDVRSLVADPSNSSIIYAGLGEGAGIFMSKDGGESWQAINNGIRVECPSYLQRVGQVRPGTTLVKASRITRGEFYSMPWTSIDAIVIDKSSGVTYAADFSLGVYVSPDRGESWYLINDGLTNRAVCALSLSPDGRMVFAATSGGGFFRLDIPRSGPKASPGTMIAPNQASTQYSAMGLVTASDTARVQPNRFFRIFFSPEV